MNSSKRQIHAYLRFLISLLEGRHDTFFMKTFHGAALSVMHVCKSEAWWPRPYQASGKVLRLCPVLETIRTKIWVQLAYLGRLPGSTCRTLSKTETERQLLRKGKVVPTVGAWSFILLWKPTSGLLVVLSAVPDWGLLPRPTDPRYFGSYHGWTRFTLEACGHLQKEKCRCQ